MQDGILMRKWRPLDTPAEEEWNVVYQIMVPQKYRQDIISLAHDSLMAGHLGVTKTYNKICEHFYWPKLKSHVSQYCKSCHICQITGKPNQVIPPAPLYPIPAFGEPFSRILIDCVGPLPKTNSGNVYLLTIMCAATRFPEAIPLRNIKARNICKALIKFFTLFGLPRSIQSDQGSNFTSKTFQQVMDQLGNQRHNSSAYHPESQGALERFHQTLKTMMKSYCLENGKDWDEGVHLLLFAVRDSVQESLGFSPYELIFGHQVRGPLTLLKEKWMNVEVDQNNLLDYVSTFKDRLTKAGEMAKNNLKLSQGRMKTWYDQDAIQRSFEPGEKVLVLFPIPGHTFQAQYSGPFEVLRKVDDRNYIIKTFGRKKDTQLCHINMLKKYFDKSMPNSTHGSVGINIILPEGLPEQTEPENIREDISESTKIKLQNSHILKHLDIKLGHLLPNQQQDITKVIKQFEGIFPDVPQQTHLASHDVDVVDAYPIKQHPYRLSPIKAEIMEKEIQYMLEHKIIEPSTSNWSSPCILVPKKDGRFRFCTDFLFLGFQTVLTE